MTDKEELEKVFNDIDNEYKDLNEKLLNISKRKNQLNEDLTN